MKRSLKVGKGDKGRSGKKKKGAAWLGLKKRSTTIRVDRQAILCANPPSRETGPEKQRPKKGKKNKKRHWNSRPASGRRSRTGKIGKVAKKMAYPGRTKKSAETRPGAAQQKKDSPASKEGGKKKKIRTPGKPPTAKEKQPQTKKKPREAQSEKKKKKLKH